MLAPRERPSRLLSLAAPFLALALTVLTSALLLLLMGRPPLETLSVYFLSPFADAFSRAELLVKAAPLALIGAGLAVCFRASVWNIGAAGQYTLGAIGASALALALPDAQGWVWVIPFLVAGALGGALWAAIPALLKTRFQASEILSTLMLTYVAAQLLDWLVRGPWRDPLSFGFPKSADFAAAFAGPMLMAGTRVHLGAALAPLAALLLWALLRWSRRGFGLIAAGMAPRAAAFGGFAPASAMWFALPVSGALAGVAGALEVGAAIGRAQPDIAAGYGFTAIIVAFLGRLNPLGALPAALMLAVTYLGAENAQIQLGLPRNATGLFQGLLLFYLLATETFIHYRLRLGGR